MDQFLNKRLTKYDNWLNQNTISHSSKVIPIMTSIEKKQWILPSEQVLNIIKSAHTIALADCVCKKHYKRCDNPVEVCLLFDDYGLKAIEEGSAKKISYDEAVSVIKMANEKGLIHLSLYRPDHKLYALCNCCHCCCHDLQLVLNHKKDYLMAHSDYVPIINYNNCTNCKTCLDRCIFNAIYNENNKIRIDFDKCYGCGLCATICSTYSIEMKLIEK